MADWMVAWLAGSTAAWLVAPMVGPTENSMVEK